MKKKHDSTTSLFPWLNGAWDQCSRNESPDTCEITPELAFIRGLDPPPARKLRLDKTKLRKSIALPRHHLKTEEEKVALKSLELKFGDGGLQKKFNSLVLALLAAIEEDVEGEKKRNRSEPASSVQIRQLRERADRLRDFAEELETPLQPFFLQTLRPSPVRQMRLYADGLDADADQLQALKRTRKGRKSACETYNILTLVELVQEFTGQKHWENLAVLLRGATHDSGYASHRLQALCSYHWRRKKSAGHGMVGTFRYLRVFSR